MKREGVYLERGCSLPARRIHPEGLSLRATSRATLADQIRAFSAGCLFRKQCQGVEGRRMKHGRRKSQYTGTLLGLSPEQVTDAQGPL